MIFILDNYDSFTYNLCQYFGELGEEVIVRRPDEVTLSSLRELNPELIVISPGPCSPNEAVFAMAVIEAFKGSVPLLGICLGHQAIGQVFGGKVVRAQKPVHGKTSIIRHDGQGVFQGLAHPLKVTRYHSLALEPGSLPEEIMVTAQTSDGEIMGIRHVHLPVESVQFHPEAILTEDGLKLLENAVRMAKSWKKEKTCGSDWQVRPFDVYLPPQELIRVFKDAEDPFFLDSGDNYAELGTHSYLGASPLISVRAYKDHLRVKRTGGTEKTISYNPGQNALTALDEFLAKFKTPSAAPFPFAGGAVGFFSYDLKNQIESLSLRLKPDLEIPLWTLAWYDGIAVYAHETGRYYLTACGMQENGQCDPDLARKRIAELARTLQEYAASISEKEFEAGKLARDNSEPGFLAGGFTLSDVATSVPRAQYLKDLARVIEYIYAGDIYQANLTQSFSCPFTGDPWELYTALRRKNAAPFSAFLPYRDFQILSSSPERFIRIDTSDVIQTRPIKGTRPRGKTPAEDQKLADELLHSEKDRAELTMIVDLERNDLGRICEYGTVRTKELMTLEKYPAVWHLVATIEGKIKKGLLPSELLRAIFPGGSITGAPKIRAMEIIDELEPYNRGIYTGCIGYIGFDGAWDLNIVIRTILLKAGVGLVHAGGGIVADSVPAEEYQETITKAGKLLETLGVALDDEPGVGRSSAK